LSDEQEDALLDTVEKQIDEFGWKDTFHCWKRYLTNKCLTPEAVINFANLFWWYGGQDHIIPDPYEFLAIFYARIDFDATRYDPMDILDSIATTILPKAGISEADLVLHTDYLPENDPVLIAAVQRLKSQHE